MTTTSHYVRVALAADGRHAADRGLVGGLTRRASTQLTPEGGTPLITLTPDADVARYATSGGTLAHLVAFARVTELYRVRLEPVTRDGSFEHLRLFRNDTLIAEIARGEGASYDYSPAGARPGTAPHLHDAVHAALIAYEAAL